MATSLEEEESPPANAFLVTGALIAPSSCLTVQQMQQGFLSILFPILCFLALFLFMSEGERPTMVQTRTIWAIDFCGPRCIRLTFLF